MTFIIHGATGAQGAPVLTRLLSSGHAATAAVRNPRGLPRGAGAVSVDLSSVASLTAAYTGAEGVFVHLPLGDGAQASTFAEAIVDALIAARPGRVVISTSGQIVDDPASPLAASPDSPIRTLIDSIESSGVSTAVVAPRLYLENLLLPVVAGPALVEGTLRYPLPATFPVSWSSHDDVADVVVRLLTDASITGTVSVGHLPALAGDDLARAFAAYLGREVIYEAITPEEFGTMITPLFGADSAAPVVGLYQALNSQPAYTIRPERSAQTLLDLIPRPAAERLAHAAPLEGATGAPPVATEASSS